MQRQDPSKADTPHTGARWAAATTRLSVIGDARLTLGDMFDRLARFRPNRRLVTELGTDEASLTYAETAERCARWSGALRRIHPPG